MATSANEATNSKFEDAELYYNNHDNKAGIAVGTFSASSAGNLTSNHTQFMQPEASSMAVMMATVSSTRSPGTPSSTNSTYTNTAELKEESKRSPQTGPLHSNADDAISDIKEEEDEEEEEVKTNNTSERPSMQHNDTEEDPFKNLPQQAEFHDINDEEDQQMVMERTRHDSSKSNKQESLDLVYTNGVYFRVWCFCCCIAADTFPTAIENCLYSTKLKCDTYLRDKRHLGVGRYLTYSICIWICIAVAMAMLLLLIVSAIQCIIATHAIAVQHEVCEITAYSVTQCAHNQTQQYVIWQAAIVNSSVCSEHGKRYNVSLDEYLYSDECPVFDLEAYDIAQRHSCWLYSCQDDEVHLSAW
eukprot:CAMPEP_0197025628 /NCGR_PEP_ID=MMETSP1384-20130603/5892_1 /TAXON_ID=29189 /ORGANISM="Ammonia sp." /LENGTH=358 /DNA_ID=CAMNT_0042454177 /DNA_START=29 /DNA_END=1102 /DNA_ORIENTATION=+